jgi:hypothetical protein
LLRIASLHWPTCRFRPIFQGLWPETTPSAAREPNLAHKLQNPPPNESRLDLYLGLFCLLTRCCGKYVMGIAKHRRLSRFLTGAVLLFLTCALNSLTARAGCGDYVTVGTKFVQTLASPILPSSHHPHPPCPGPTCSNRTEAPTTAPAVPPPSERSEQWGFSASLQAVVYTPPAADFLHLQLSCQPVHCDLAIFHPPR